MIASRLVRPVVTIRASTAALIAVLAVAFGLRVYGLDWDNGHYLHPDERHIVADIMVARISLVWPPDIDALLDPATSPLNPRSADPESGRAREFAYGALPVYITELAAEALNRFTETNWHDYGNAYKVGRFISAVMDTITVLLVFLIGTRLASRRVGLVAAAIAATMPMTIQLAHFFTTDSWLTTFVALCLYCCIRAGERGEVRWFLAAGTAFGLAMATKGSVFTLAGIVALAVAYDLWRRWNEGESLLEALTAVPERVAVTGFGAVVAFALFEPYALAQPDVYRQSLSTQATIVQGTFDVPFTRQYIGTTPILYQLEQLLRFGMGPVAGILALAGVPLLVWRLLRGRRAAELVILVWLLGYGLVIALPETKFLRYLAPLAPVLAITAALALDQARQVLAKRFDRRVAIGFAALALAGVGLWTASFEAIYAHENTRLRASAWILANVPGGSVLSNEYWDDALPKGLGPGLTSEDRQFSSVTFDLYSDRVAWSDLVAYMGYLERHPLTRPAADALVAGDYRAAADLLRSLGPAATALAPDERGLLALTFNGAATQLHGPAARLGDVTNRAASALRDDPELITAAFMALGDALLAAGDAETGNYLYGQLAQIDYYVISSNRVLASLPHSPWRYPVQIRFYELLASGQLGFELVAEFTQHPGLGPLRFDDDAADESWLNYDHPHVWIYRKIDLVPRVEYDLLMADARAAPVSPTRYAPERLMLDEPVGDLPVVDDARWSEVLTGGSWGAALVWLALLVLLQIAGWPLAQVVFGRFADGGWSFARMLAIMLAGFLLWLGASLEVIAFRAIWSGATLLLVAMGGWLLWLRLGRRGPTAAQWRVALVAEVAFWAIFGLFVFYRYLNPDSWHPFWGGEKPMEFAHLNATLRSAHFPPYDPWFAGGYVNYYYYGLYLVAYLLRLTGIPSEIGFNLAQPTVIALAALAAFGVAATLGRDLVARARRQVPARVAAGAGLLGVMLLVCIGNLKAFTDWLDQPEAEGFIARTWTPSRAISGAITEFPYFTGLYADLHAHVIALPITILAIALGYALAGDARRVAPAVLRPRRYRRSAIVIGTRFLLLALACGTLFATNAWDVPTYLGIGGMALFLATARVRPIATRLLVWLGATALLGVLAYALFLPFHLHYVALFSSIARTDQATSFWEFTSHLGGLLAIAAFGLVGLLAARAREAPLLGQPVVPVTLVVVLLYARVLAPADAVALRDALTSAVAIIPTIALLAAAWSALGRGVLPVWTGDLGLYLARGGLVATGLLAIAAIAGDRAVFGMMLAALVAATALWLVGESAAVRYLALLVATAAALTAALEVVFLVDDLRGTDHERMNSIFKFYYQVWTLLALTGAAFIARMAVEIWPGLRGAAHHWIQQSGVLGFSDGPIQAAHPAEAVEDDRNVPGENTDDAAQSRPTATRLLSPVNWSRTGIVVTAVVLALSLAFPALATRPRLEQRFTTDLGSGTLDALDWMEYGTITTLPDPDGRVHILSFADDRAAIDWFWENVEGSPVIVEASIGPYRCNGSRFSIATGLPAVIGWDRHLRQQRFPEGIDQRVRDVRMLYATPDPETKLQILRQYGVEYVVVGPLERLGIEIAGNDCRPTDVAAGIAAFDALVGSSLDVVFQQGETTIYRVLPEPASP